MRTQWILVPVMALALMLAAGCSSSSSTTDAHGNVLDVSPVTIHSRTAGSDSALQDTGVYLVNDQSTLENFGSQELLKITADFETQSIIILAQGQCPTAGHWVHIDGIQKLGDTLYVQGTVNVPGDGATAQVITYPYEAAIVSKVTGTLIPDVTRVSGQEHPADGDVNAEGTGVGNGDVQGPAPAGME